MKKNILVLIPIALIVFIGVLLTYVLDSPPKRQEGLEPDPNKDFAWSDKTDFLLKFKGERVVYEFERRNPKDNPSMRVVYDPSNWLLTLAPQSDETARFAINEGPIETLTGTIGHDGLFRVDSYKGIQGEPREFWQTLFNILFFLPRNKKEIAEPGLREFEFPAAADHLITGKVRFCSAGQVVLNNETTEAIEVYIDLEVLTKAKRDKLTEFMAEGILYYLPRQKLLVAGEWEWATGFIDQIYILGGNWNYVLFYTNGFKPKDKVKDYATLSSNMRWGWIRDTNSAEWQINAFEMGARNKLFNMEESEEIFRSSILVDQDGDGAGEYGFLRELAKTASKLRSAGGYREWPVKVPDLKLLTSYGDVNERGYSTVDGYRFKLFLNSSKGLVSDDSQVQGNAADADFQEKPESFCIYAWPEEFGKTGRKGFFTNGGGKVWSTAKPPFNPSMEIPAPKSTALPGESEWQPEVKGKMFETKYQFVTYAGTPVESKAQEHLAKIAGYMNQLNFKHQDKMLGDDEYRRAVKLIRAFMKAKSDSVMTGEEARSLAMDLGSVYSSVLLRNVGTGLLALADTQALQNPMPKEKAEEFAVLRNELTAMKADPDASPEKSEDLVDRITDFLNRGW